MTIYKGQEFSGRVEIDGNSYVACTFEDVVLVYAGGEPPSFAGCIFREWRFAFEGPAGNTINFLKSMGPKQSGFSDVLRQTFPEVAASGAPSPTLAAMPRPASPPH